MQVTPHIHALKVPFKIPIAPGQTMDRFVYCYLIYGESVCVVDSGVAGTEKVIFDYLARTGRSPKEIDILVLTHSHPDHIGSAAAIKQATGCTVLAHKDEVGWIEDISRQERERPVPGFSTLVWDPVTVDHPIEDGNLIKLGDGLEVIVLHTPGHSKGSISLYVPEDMALICGDAVPLAGGLPIYEDPKASAESIRRLRGISCVETLLSSWDDPRTGDAVPRILDEGSLYLSHIDQTVKAVAAEGITDPVGLCRRVVEELGLPQFAVNALVARSFMASLRQA
jgi:glyoxylase-like metal-dependent hydrolase (beta-lactamase superfamily II)